MEFKHKAWLKEFVKSFVITFCGAIVFLVFLYLLSFYYEITDLLLIKCVVIVTIGCVLVGLFMWGTEKLGLIKWKG